MALLVLSFLIGLLLLVKGASYLVKGASVVARKLGISSLIVGLTIVAMATSLPELVVSVTASVRQVGDLAIGTIVGSNISNILLILGIAALITPLTVQISTIWKEIPFSIFAAVVLAVQANDIFFLDGVTNKIGRGNGLIMLVFFALYLYYVVQLARNGGRPLGEKMVERRIAAKKKELFPSESWPIIILEIVGGLLLLVGGGHLLVEGGVGIARLAGVSEAVIGLTMVAVGTSLPELSATAVAAWRREPDIAVGNIVGTNIFNILFVLGATAVVRPLPFSAAFNVDVLLLLAITVIFFSSILFLGKRFVVTRGNGVLFLVLYVAYVAFVYLRSTPALAATL